MAVLRSLLVYGLVFVALIGGGALVYNYYSWIFSKNVQGEIVEIERITTPTAILGRSTESQLHSYSIMIRDDKGEMHISSSEDKQWQIAKKGYCALALFYRYPFWELNKANTFFNARLKKIYVCPGKSTPQEEAPPQIEAPGEKQSP